MGVLRTFEQSCKSAADASQKQLLFILKDNADTEYGKKYHFSDISSVSEYKKQPEAACMTRGMSRIAKCIDNYGGLE